VKYTNKYKIPESIVSAILKTRMDYDNEGSDLSASSITIEPKQFWLKKKYQNEVVFDIRDMYRSFIGTVAHNACEQAAKDDSNLIVEVRYSTYINGWKVSAKIDRYDVSKKKLTDLKFSSIYSLSNPPKDEYIAQLNTQRFLMSLDGVEVSEMELDISAVDWYESRSINPDYPSSPCKSLKVEIWPLERVRGFLEDRVKLLQSYEDTDVDEIPPCCEKYRWKQDDVWAVYKDNKSKRASKLHSDEISAKVHASNCGGRVEFRKGLDKRCMSYCEVNKHCSYWKENYGSE